MRNGRSKGAMACAFEVNVNPLVVSRGLGKLIDVFLGNLNPFAGCYFLPDAIG